MPPSVNASHVVSGGRWNTKTRKNERVKTRSPEYTQWISDLALPAYRVAFPGGAQLLTGRLRVDCAYCYLPRWLECSDTDNRIKCLHDFLQKKLYENDKAIDEIHAYKRVSHEAAAYVLLRVTEIPDRRFEDPELIF